MDARRPLAHRAPLLAAVAEGAGTAGEAFVRGAAREARPYLGDTWAFAAIERLARGEVPLLSVGAGVVDRHTPVALTDAGRRCSTRRDHVPQRVTAGSAGAPGGRGVPWRWDEGVEAIVASAAALDGAARRKQHHRGKGGRAPAAREGGPAAG